MAGIRVVCDICGRDVLSWREPTIVALTYADHNPDGALNDIRTKILCFGCQEKLIGQLKKMCEDETEKEVKE